MKNHRAIVGSIGVLWLLGATSLCALDNGLARVPYMGWNTWYSLHTNYTLPRLKVQVDALVATGLRDLGYKIVWLDSGWAYGHNADGTISSRIDLKEFCAYVHSQGLLAGIYTDTSDQDCGFAQSFGSGTHEQSDMDYFVACGFDAVKVDCRGGKEQWRFEKMRDAIANRMIFNICAFRTEGWEPQTGHSWRTGKDIKHAGYLASLDRNMLNPGLTAPGAYADPDYLGILDRRWPPTTDVVLQKSQFSMWAMMASPLILGFRLDKADPAVVEIYKNKEIIEINQDPLCYHCRKVFSKGFLEVYRKNLHDGSIAVAFLNRGDKAADIAVKWSDLGLEGDFTVRDLWEHADKGEASGSYTAREVQPNGGCVIVKIRRVGHPLRR